MLEDRRPAPRPRSCGVVGLPYCDNLALAATAPAPADDSREKVTKRLEARGFIVHEVTAAAL
eukprot:716149-Lingulodinium_polyedra.AAC.1